MDQEALHRNDMTGEKEGCTVADISNLLSSAVKKAMIGTGDSSVEHSHKNSSTSLDKIAPVAKNRRKKGQPVEVPKEKDFDKNTKINETFVENIDQRNLFY